LLDECDQDKGKQGDSVFLGRSEDGHDDVSAAHFWDVTRMARTKTRKSTAVIVVLKPTSGA